VRVLARLLSSVVGGTAVVVVCYVVARRRRRSVSDGDGGPSPLVIPLWPGRAHPCMRIHLPVHLPDGDAKQLAAMICFHGGGWSTCWGSGKGTAAWAASKGMVGVEVEYAAAHGALQVVDGKAVPPAEGESDVLEPLAEGGAPYPQCLRDAGRAVRLVRSLGSKGELPVDTEHVCACGFSAGGWLVGMLCTMDADYLANVTEDDLGADWSCVPNRAAICYGVTTLLDHSPPKLLDAIRLLLGAELHEQVSLRENLSPACHFGEDTPPLFIWHTANDATVPVAHALEAFKAAREAHVPNVELHLYGAEGQAGRHAQGLASNNPALCGWSDQLLAWLGEDFRDPR